MNPAQINALQRVALAVLDAIVEGGDLGAPAGILFAALMHQGASLSQFNSFMSTLTSNDMLRKEGDCYFITEAGMAFRDKLRRKFSTANPARAAAA